MTINGSHIIGVVRSVTKEWARQRKAEERGRRSRSSRVHVYSNRVNFTDVMDEILPAAYMHASDNGKFTVPKRNIYYAAREAIKQATGRDITAAYLTKTVLVRYMNEHPETASWKITADPRGALTIPNARYEVHIPCGTLAIDEHLRDIHSAVATDINVELPIEWPSLQPGQRYQGVVYIEKEGFDPMLEEAQIPERFHVAVISCKGQSVVAARRFVDHVCRVNGGVPLFTVHDFDKSGFEFAQRLTKVSDWARKKNLVKYEFQNEINVTDLGLRLADVEEYKLAHESVKFEGGFARDSIATPEEREFLRSGRRVELNAFTAPQLIEWLERKLTEHGLGKPFIPNDEVLEAAYRRARAVAELNRVLKRAIGDAARMGKEATIPKSLRRQLRKAMKDSPAAWDKALYHMAAAKLEGSDDE